MANIFSGSEIVELGIQIEKNGRDFYNTIAGQTRDPRIKKVFVFLKGEEEKHIIVFQEMLESVGRYEPPESYPGEYLAYMSALAVEYVFTQENKGNEIAQKIKGDKEAVDIGIKFEKDSVVFYEGMKKVVPISDHKAIDNLVAQEQSHLKQLLDLRASI
ncbi:MAG: ferritin family protein [Candidatus Omnitrophota bacterium]